MKQIFVVIITLMSLQLAQGAGTKIGDLYYNLNSTTQTAVVTYYKYDSFDSSANADYVKGDIEIPEKVVYDGKTYSVTSIGEKAFYGCSGLTSVTIPNSVTSIGSEAFSGCSSMISVTIPNSVTSIGDAAFYGCSRLTTIDVAQNNPFYASKDGVLYFKNYDTLICYPGGLEGDFEIPNSVTSIGFGALAGCSGLTSVTIPNSVTSIGNSAFYCCSGLTSVTIPNSVTSIEDYAFYGCTNMTSVTIPNSVISIGNSAFYGCSGLTSVTIPNSVTSIGNSAFSGCTGLKKSAYPNTISANPFPYGYAIKYPAGNSEIESGILYGENRSAIYYVPLDIEGNFAIPSSVTSIGDGAFAGCSGLTSVTIPNSVTSIGEYAFYGCSGLTSVLIGSSVTSIEDATFYGCSSLTSVTIPNSVTSIGWSAFEGCSGLTSLNIPNSVTSIGAGAFRGCSGLTSLTIPNSIATVGSYAFSGCSGLESITINTTGILSLGAGAFANCENLLTIYCNTQRPPVAESYEVFANQAYSNATVYVPEPALNLYYTAIPWNKFYNIKGLVEYAEVEINFVGSTTLEAGQTLQLTLSPVDMPSVILEASWSSSNTEVATVNGSGLVTAIAAGTAVITATDAYGHEATVTITVATGENSGLETVISGEETMTIFNVNGILVKKNATREDIEALNSGVYIIGGKKVFVK